ncbi:Mitochondrial Rho GTPase 1 [Sesamum angolense]|uniref:Mitochondrial Rho GTPase 1 n=1 Tax=Sesamum angolense TaxID=2727404 RepID=A0AAE2BZ06_9LAMI|nr:Mitochondrial Rho GTPase 1 [Sesamum angolense]
MAGGASASGAAGNAVRIVVAGDAKTGKSSLIVTAAAENFPTNVPPVLPPTRLPEDLYPDRVPVTIIDTSSSPENRGKLVEELTRADAVVLTYACDRPETLDRLSTYWLPELRRLEVKVPVIVVGCMLDKRGDQQPVSLEQVMSPIMQQFREIETCIECSALNHIQIPEVFYYAQKAVLHPTAPLFDQEQQVLKPRCVRALKRIFILCDHDRDGALSDAELNDFQVKCFNAPLQPSEIVGVKRVVQEKLPEGVDDRGLTLTGFLFLHALFIEKGRLETTWTSVELTTEAAEFLRKIFFTYDVDGDGALRSAELEDLFSTAPEKNVFWKSVAFVEGLLALGAPMFSVSWKFKKTLVLREIPEEGVKELLSKKDALAACDVAVFVHDSYCFYMTITTAAARFPFATI